MAADNIMLWNVEIPFTVTCPCCHIDYDDAYYPGNIIREEEVAQDVHDLMLKEGWVERDGVLVCPECAEKEEEE